MPQFFLKLLNMSISASWVVLAVLILRFAMKKAPKWMTCALWAIVAFRLVIPVSIESIFSLIPSTETLPQQIITGNRFEIDSGIPVINQQINDGILDHYYEGITVPVDHGLNTLSIAGIIWLAGVALLLLYAAITYLRLRWKVSASIHLREHIFLCDYIDSPFILGVIHPRIYLPSALEESSVPHVLAHENAHLARKDHWWKPLGFGLLCLHWFNPILWLAYILLCKDIELACDEKVIQTLGEGEKRSYSQALLQCSVPRHLIAACPLAFGEVGVKERVKSVLNYKKPAFWIILIALIVCVAVAVCFLTDPVSEDDPTPSLPITEDASSFWAEVLEVNGNSLLVRPEPGAWEASSADKITLSVPDGCAIPAVGDRVHIVYDGQLACSYPAQILHCSLITIVSQSPEQPVDDSPCLLRSEITQDGSGNFSFVLYYNLKGTGEIWAYQAFTLEHQVKGQWVTIGAPAQENAPLWFKGTGTNDPYSSSTKLSHPFTISEFTDEKLEPGLYRISVTVYATAGDYPAVEKSYTEIVSAQFSVLPDEIPSYSSVEEAILDGCVTMINGDIVAGQHPWQNFVETTSQGQSASIRLFYYTTFSGPANYDPSYIQDVFVQHPNMIIYDLVYDGANYNVYAYQNGKGNFRQYPYLLHYTGVPEDQYADYDSFDRYVLCNDNTLTWEELYHLMGVSFTDVRQSWIVTDLIYDDEPTQQQLGAAENQLLPYWAEYNIVTTAVNAITGKLDIVVTRWVDGIDTLIERYIPLRCVSIVHGSYAPQAMEASMTMVDATATEGLAVCELQIPPRSEVWTGYEYHLEVLTEIGWGYYGLLSQELSWPEALLFHYENTTDEAYTMTVPFFTQWDSTIAEEQLSPGTYRYCKSFAVYTDGYLDYVTCYAVFEVPENTPAGPGLHMEILDPTDTGATLAITNNGGLLGEMITNGQYYLNVIENGGAKVYGRLPSQVDWDDVIYTLKEGQTIYLEVSWATTAEAPLPTGTYSITLLCQQQLTIGQQAYQTDERLVASFAIVD